MSATLLSAAPGSPAAPPGTAVATPPLPSPLPAPPAPPPGAPPAPAHLSAPPAPAAQLAPALLSLAKSDGSSILTLRLEPATLGQVEVRITLPPDGPAGVQVTATQPQTLLLLVRDQPLLQQALGHAGIAVDARNLSFHLAPPPAPSAAAVAAGGTMAEGSFGPGAGGAATRDSAPRRRRTTLSGAPDAVQDAAALSPGVRWLRAGLDITA
ncbi:MAG: flagellar hook-length control protein FliK [Acetobacteraceae bacterium]